MQTDPLANSDAAFTSLQSWDHLPLHIKDYQGPMVNGGLNLCVFLPPCYGPSTSSSLSILGN